MLTVLLLAARNHLFELLRNTLRSSAHVLYILLQDIYLIWIVLGVILTSSNLLEVQTIIMKCVA